MKCKYCEAELPEDTSLCPACGKDNAPAPENTAQSPAEKLSTNSKLVMVIAALLVLIAVLVVVLIVGMNGGLGGSDTPDTTVSTEADPTIPDDGDPNDETCKGTYTAEDATVMASHDTVVATMGNLELTNGELQIYYWMSVFNFISYNSSYLSYYGLDLAQDLDTQLCPIVEGCPWQQYFLKTALDNWRNFAALTDLAEKNQFQLPEDYAEDLANLRDTMEEAAANSGFDSPEAMLVDEMGGGCTFADYESYMYEYYMGYLYYSEECDKITVTDDEIAAFFQEHKEEYETNGLTEDYCFYDVRHILIQPEGGTTEGTTTTYSDEEWEACRVKAQALLDQWLAEDGTEDGFAELAKTHSVDGSAKDGGIYTDLTSDTNFVPEFKNWYLDESRVPGNSGLVKTTYGYHLMYFIGSEPAWPAYAEEDLLVELQEKLLDDVIAAHPITTDYSKILLANVVLVSES